MDVIRAGGGDDTVVLRTATDNAEFYGGEGVDTLILPNTVSGSVDLSDFTAFASNVSVSGFDNLDARAATTSVVLKGDAEATALLAGSGTDEVWLGAGGDTARGGGGADVFVVDLSTASTGGSILDLKTSTALSFMMAVHISLRECFLAAYGRLSRSTCGSGLCGIN